MSEETYDFSPETVENKRKFPILSTFLLFLLVAVQIFAIVMAIRYQPEPQDVIEEYTVYVSPSADGSLDIEYRFIWTPLDPEEELTWVEIGMANEHFMVWGDRSGNIERIGQYTDDEGYCSARVYFKRPYRSGETLEFYFKVNQRFLLATDGSRKFYEFIPSWFNYTPVEHYTFYFEQYGDIAVTNCHRQEEDLFVWEGELSCGEYVPMRVDYNSFDAVAVQYRAFDSDGCYDGLAEDKSGAVVFATVVALMIFVGELFIIDSYVSYARGRGFLRGYGHHVHVYGYRNPHYTSAANSHRGSGGGGGGCACACACACAGGGRAGCSQKDTYGNKKEGINL